MSDFDRVRDYLTALQDRICNVVETIDGQSHFHEDHWQRTGRGGTYPSLA